MANINQRAGVQGHHFFIARPTRYQGAVDSITGLSRNIRLRPIKDRLELFTGGVGGVASGNWRHAHGGFSGSISEKYNFDSPPLRRHWTLTFILDSASDAAFMASDDAGWITHTNFAGARNSTNRGIRGLLTRYEHKNKKGRAVSAPLLPIASVLSPLFSLFTATFPIHQPGLPLVFSDDHHRHVRRRRTECPPPESVRRLRRDFRRHSGHYANAP